MKDFNTLWGIMTSRSSFLSKMAKQQIMKGKTPWGTKNLQSIQSIWKDEELLKKFGEDPTDYASVTRTSEYLFEQVSALPHISKQSLILEIGCNVGRNLNYLFKQGYHNIFGIEISQRAVKLMKEQYPEMSKYVTILHGSVEDEIVKLKDNQFDLTFSNAVLMHLHPSSNWIFKEMSRITSKYVRTMEVENLYYYGVFPRDYQIIFEQFGWKMIKQEINNWKNEPEYLMRVFEKQN